MDEPWIVVEHERSMTSTEHPEISMDRSSVFVDNLWISMDHPLNSFSLYGLSGVDEDPLDPELIP